MSVVTVLCIFGAGISFDFNQPGLAVAFSATSIISFLSNVFSEGDGNV